MQLNNDDILLFQSVIHNQLTYSQDGAAVEFVIRPECNQKCEYCYLTQYGKESYRIRATKEQILNNLKMVVDYFIEQDYKIKRLDLFAGDLFYDDLFFDMVPILEKYYIWLNNTHYDFINQHLINDTGRGEPCIIIPCNMSFCNDDNKIKKVEAIVRRMNKLNVKLFFSYSTDGKYSTSIREKKVIEDEFFDKVFALCEKYNWGVHPMISYEGIDNTIENYKWFKKKFKQFKLNNGSTNPYYLEVRNDGWTDEALQKYKEFLQFYLNDIFHNENGSDLERMFNDYFRAFEVKGRTYVCMDNGEALGKLNIIKENHMPCGLGILDLSINISAMTLMPCHRLGYNELIGGKFKIKDNKIQEIIPTEYYNSYINLLYLNNSVKPKCITCKYHTICMKGCAGAQYEYSGDAFTSIPSVCKMLEVKYSTTIDFYHSIGLFHYIFKNEPLYPCNKVYQEILIASGYDEYKIYQNLGEL